MSDLFRTKVNGVPPSEVVTRPRPAPIATPNAYDVDDHSSSSDSSASSAASIATVRPSSREFEAGPTHWTHFFEQELFLDDESTTQRARYHVYLSKPTDLAKGPLFICHHGAGASGLSFAALAQEIKRKLPEAGILSLEARSHGSTITNFGKSLGEDLVTDFSLEALVSDAESMITLTAAKMGWITLPPSVLVGHSLGGAVVTTLASSPHFKIFGSSLIGYCVIDVVEGSAIEALRHMKTYLSTRPSIFASLDEAIDWHTHTRTLRNRRSAEASVPSLLVPATNDSDKLVWRTDLSSTSPWWEEWFTNMSVKFLTGRGAKLLILAGTDRLDRELMIGQMQGKFQLVVIPEAGHFVQEDVPEKTAGLLVEFFKRNDRSQMVLPPKVADLIKQGKKV